MPIRPPALDDRSFEDLVAELVSRIPAHTPEWTNPRQGDPGRTLIELFAWLGDTLLYRANLIPERQRLAFLRLLGMPLKPAVPARGIVALDVKPEPAPVALDIAPGSTIDKPAPFTTQQFCTTYPLEGRAYIKRRLDDDERGAFNKLLPDLQAVYGRRDGTPTGYVTTEAFPGGNARFDGMDMIADAVDRCLWIALLAPTPKLKAAARNTLDKSADGAPRAINVGLALAYDIPPLDADVGQRVQIPGIWEMTTASTDANVPSTVVLETLSDTTRHLSRHGVVRLSLPPLAMIGAPSNDPRENLTAGVGNAPPRLDAPEDADRLVSWLRLRIAPGYPIDSLKLAWVGINAVEIEQREVLPGRAIGTSDGGSDQVFDLGVSAAGSVDAATLEIVVQDPIAGLARYARVDDCGSASPLDTVYQLDAEAGTVRFGDGVHGRVPSAGSRITAQGLRVGGGVRGNLPPGAVSKLDSLIDLVTGQKRKPDPQVTIRQPLPISGGADAERLVEAERRIPSYFTHRDRAVTAADHRVLAREAPGVEVGRVDVLPRFKPHERQSDVPGVVSVMVLPARGTVDFSAPYPRADRPLLETVHEYLSVRRPLATELYVIGCVYKPLGVSVGVQIREGHAREQVLSDVRLALRRYLWPLPLGVGGLLGDWPQTMTNDGGYPLGRPLTDRELEVAVARVNGVAGVAPVRLFEKRAGKYVELPGAGKIVTRFALEAWELPELTALAVVEGMDSPSSVLQPYGERDGNEVFMPVVPELC
ncbi:MAG TPA: putative baseplate assembly protein [Burkholderiaceae bacterium]|nr:putative baseplate assembly protein [Burkholderiaceae bacterium]